MRIYDNLTLVQHVDYSHLANGLAHAEPTLPIKESDWPSRLGKCRPELTSLGTSPLNRVIATGGLTRRAPPTS